MNCKQHSLLVSYVLPFMLLFSCQQEASPPQRVEKTGLEYARSRYQNGDFATAAQVFAAQLKGNEAKKQPEVKQEALLGIIVCKLLAGMDWQQYLQQWQPSERYYWEGKSFTAHDGLAKSEQSYFASRIPQAPHRAYWLLLTFLLRQKQYQPLPQLINQLEKIAAPASELCTAWGWQYLKQGQYQQAVALFAAITSQLRRPDNGALLAKLLAEKNNLLSKAERESFSNSWQYQFERRQIDFFRSYSPLAQYQKNLATAPLAAKVDFLIADMIFVLGRRASTPLYVWQQGQQLLDRYRKQREMPDLQPVYQCLEDRFAIAIAWSLFIAGDDERAAQIFQKFAEKKPQSNWHAESQLARALLNWKQEAYLDELAEQFVNNTWPEYWLGGKKFSFYRLAARNERRQSIEKLCTAQPVHRNYLTVLDALCLLGDGRTAYHILGKVVENYPAAEVQKIYLAEQNAIPKDVYAESQIWEKMD